MVLGSPEVLAGTGTSEYMVRQPRMHSRLVMSNILEPLVRKGDDCQQVSRLQLGKYCRARGPRWSNSHNSNWSSWRRRLRTTRAKGLVILRWTHQITMIKDSCQWLIRQQPEQEAWACSIRACFLLHRSSERSTWRRVRSQRSHKGLWRPSCQCKIHNSMNYEKIIWSSARNQNRT